MQPPEPRGSGVLEIASPFRPSRLQLAWAMSRFFSNGTEGRAWEALWCQRCKNDHDMHSPDGSGGCEFLMFAMAGMEEELDGIWFDETEKFGFTFPPAVRCTKFEACVACGDGDVTLNADGYPSAVRQREWAHFPDGRRVLVTDNELHPPEAP